MHLTFKISGIPYFYLSMSKLSLFFNEYKNHEYRGIALYRDYNIVCYYDISLKAFEKKIIEAKKKFVRENINNQFELKKYDKHFGDIQNIIALIEKEKKRRD